MAKNTAESRLKTLDLYENCEDLQKVASALSVKTRQDIIRLINLSPHSINQIAWKLNIPVSTASFHVKVLVEAGLLQYSETPNKRGNEKTVSLGAYLFTLFLGAPTRPDHPVRKVEVVDIPIGSYTDHSVSPTCGILSEDGIFLVSDTPAVFYSPMRFTAGLIWLKKGYLEYTVPMLDYIGSQDKQTVYRNKNHITSLCFQFEICSETVLYNHDYKSDVTFSVNGIEACTFTTSGDFGERRGRLNPDRLTDSFTQYGMLETVDIRFDGTYLNEKRVSDVCIGDLRLSEQDTLTFRIQVKDDAKHVGGFNLFGKSFGDHAQDIRLSITYQEA